jgi:hypothetical protein
MKNYFFYFLVIKVEPELEEEALDVFYRNKIIQENLNTKCKN